MQHHIKDSIIKYQLKQFCRRNTRVIALLLKALLQGSKHYPKAVLQQDFFQSHSKQDSSSKIQSSAKQAPKVDTTKSHLGE